ncbi:Membrane protein FxsA [Pseudomonas sp. OF001]|uniref:FxsA family protein n=1 Tax=unclassified Pseudomonas TaxID=196821 RepID=UPI0010A6A4A5|nr:MULTISPECIES: FxsA family protein [unclassified Pseudomonas]THG86817.1 membrane protein FxsA [Pseudomonas sp. A-1]CAD5375697.1 Membrane protein FxsA [Pseudomonas sp. OF001]
MRLLLSAFILFPLLELAVLIAVGSHIGVLATLLLVVASALAGGFLLRIAGPATAWRARARLLAGEAPEQEMLDGLLLALGGFLLLLPGLISDVLGILCLLPFTRHALRQRLLRSAARRRPQAGQAAHEPAQSRPQVIEGEWQRHDD